MYAVFCRHERNSARIVKAVSAFSNSVYSLRRGRRTLELPMRNKNNAGKRKHAAPVKVLSRERFFGAFYVACFLNTM